MGWGENAWYKRLAVCIGHCSQDRGVGIWCLGLAELLHVGSNHSFMIGCLEAKHCPTVLVTLFYFLYGLLQMVMKTCSDVCRSSLEGSIDFQQILVLSKSEKLGTTKKTGDRCCARAGLVNYSCERWCFFVTPPHDYREVSKNLRVVQVAFLQLPVEYLPDHENHVSIWHKTIKPNPD